MVSLCCNATPLDLYSNEIVDNPSIISNSLTSYFIMAMALCCSGKWRISPIMTMLFTMLPQREIQNLEDTGLCTVAIRTIFCQSVF